MKISEKFFSSMQKLPEAFGLFWIMLTKRFRDRYLEALVMKKENEAKLQEAMAYKLKAEGHKANMEAVALLRGTTDSTTSNSVEKIDQLDRKLVTITESIEVSPAQRRRVKKLKPETERNGSNLDNHWDWVEVLVPAQHRTITKQVFA